MLAVVIAKSSNTHNLLTYGMLAGCLAPIALFFGGYQYQLGWWTTTVRCPTTFFQTACSKGLPLSNHV